MGSAKVANIITHSSVAIDNLYSLFREHPSVGIACLYADYKDQSNQTLVNILGSFLNQFLTTVPEPIPEEVTQKLNDINNGGRKVEIEDILGLLKIRLLQLSSAFICIDAVDELEPKVRRQLLIVLKELVMSNNLRLFLTGRSHIESEVQKYFKIPQSYSVIISASQQDIREFMKQQIMDDLNPDAMDEGLAKDIVDALIKKSQGM